MPAANNGVKSSSHGSAGINRQKQLPLHVVVQIAMNGMKIRFWRSMVTAAGILLGIAFLSFVLTNLVSSEHATSDERARQIWLVVMSLMVSTVGITNSMLMSVTERFREIGTMKCLGALDGFVVQVFFVEALIVGIVASLAGWAVGFAGSVLMSTVQVGWQPAVALLSAHRVGELLLVCTGIGAVLTMIATIAPAMRAAAMPAAAALRTEV